MAPPRCWTGWARSRSWRILSHGETIRFGDIVLTVDERGPAEASSNTVFHAPATGELFASDLIYSGCHPWLAEGRLEQWLEQIRITQARYPDATVVHAGHGPSGDHWLFDAQARYIRRFEALVQARAEGGGLTEAARAEVRQAMLAAFPSHPLRFLIDLNADAIAAGLAESAEAGR
jgi:glyoxylase-like metal-dependent hydrolase (beta-lactamase superfamily II)